MDIGNVGYLWISVNFYICQIFLNICSHLSSPLHQTTGVSPLVQQLPTEEVDHHWQNVKLFLFQSSVRGTRFKIIKERIHFQTRYMQFVLSARRTLTGLPDIGSYKVSQPPTTTSTIQPSTLWIKQVSTSLSTMITIQRLTNPQQVSTRKNVC